MRYKKFTKEDLKPGYIVVFGGKPRMVMPTESELLRLRGRDEMAMVMVDVKGCWTDIDYFDSDLCYKGRMDLEVTEVYGYSRHANAACKISTDGRPLLWTREGPAKKITVAEIEKELGYKVEIVADD